MTRAALHFKFTHLKWNRPLSISSLQCSGCSAVREAFNFKIACASFCPGNRLFSYLCLSVMAMLSLRARGTVPGARVHRGNCPPCGFRLSFHLSTRCISLIHPSLPLQNQVNVFVAKQPDICYSICIYNKK
jgi:hypothetical protein